MSDIVADAKAWLSDRDNSTLRTHSEHCHQWHAECLVARLVAEVERHRMTPGEREAGNFCAVRLAGLYIGGLLAAYLDRTAPKEVKRE